MLSIIFLSVDVMMNIVWNFIVKWRNIRKWILMYFSKGRKPCLLKQTSTFSKQYKNLYYQQKDFKCYVQVNYDFRVLLPSSSSSSDLQSNCSFFFFPPPPFFLPCNIIIVYWLVYFFFLLLVNDFFFSTWKIITSLFNLQYFFLT